jgi:hypothetical protein
LRLLGVQPCPDGAKVHKSSWRVAHGPTGR